MKIGYARVSTDDQLLDLQITSLKEMGCDKIISEKISSVKERPELNRTLSILREGDTLVVWKLDRLARSLKQLIFILDDLQDRGINFISISDFINTSSAHSTMYAQMLGIFAQFERQIMIERTNAGLAEAKRRGVVLGRRPGLSDEARAKAHACKRLYEDNMGVLDICNVLHICRGTFYKYLKEMNVPLRQG